MTSGVVVDGHHQLCHHGFSGRPIYGAHGRMTLLHYRRQWRCGSVDVVLIFAEGDAEAYRTDQVDDQIYIPDPLNVESLPNVEFPIVGSVDEVVDDVLTWPEPPPVWPASARTGHDPK